MKTRFLISCNLGTGILSNLHFIEIGYWWHVRNYLNEIHMTIANFWISIPKVNHNDNKAWTISVAATVQLGAWNFGQQFMSIKKTQCSLTFTVINVK
jgi:hypothetical protein